MKILINKRSYKKILLLIIIIGCTCFIIRFIKSCNYGFGFQAGSGLGSLVDIGNEKYKSEYVKKYAEFFLKANPQYLTPKDDPANAMTSGYEFLEMTNIYFDKYPKEIYCVQWNGTGFISVRFAYNCETKEEVVENRRENVLIPDSTKERMTRRLRVEVLDKIDSIISKSKDSVNAISKLTF